MGRKMAGSNYEMAKSEKDSCKKEVVTISYQNKKLGRLYNA